MCKTRLLDENIIKLNDIQTDMYTEYLKSLKTIEPLDYEHILIYDYNGCTECNSSIEYLKDNLERSSKPFLEVIIINDSTLINTNKDNIIFDTRRAFKAFPFPSHRNQLLNLNRKVTYNIDYVQDFDF